MPAPLRPIIPGDWNGLEQVIKDIWALLNEDVTLSDMVSDINVGASDLTVVSDALSDAESDLKVVSDSLSDTESEQKVISDALSALTVAGAIGGSDTQFQYNNGGIFGGVASATYNDATGAIAFQPAADSTTFVQIKNAAGTVTPLNIDTTNNQVTIGYTSETYPFLINSPDASDQIKFYLDSNNAYMTWTDGRMIFRTDEGTDTDTILSVEGKGTGYGSWRAYDEDSAEYLQMRCVNKFGYIETDGTDPKPIRIQYRAEAGVQFFHNCASGEVEEVEISGFRTGDARRTLEIGVGKDGDDSASFDGLSNYLFDGNVSIGAKTNPETLLELTSTAPYLTLHNSTEEDADGGRESRLIFKGHKSGEEEGTLGMIEVSHDGAVDDYGGKWVLSTHTKAEAGADTLVTALTIDSTQKATFAGDVSVQGLSLNIVAKTAAYTATVNDDVITCGAGNETFTIDLPAPVTDKVFYIKNVGTGVITVDADTTGSTTIDGETTQTIDQYECIQCVSDASVYWVI